NDVTLISRYKETRRSHPLSPQGRILDGVELERKLSTDLKSQADIVIDTTNVTPRNLKLRLNKLFGHDEGNDFYVEVMSFGFKYGLPLDRSEEHTSELQSRFDLVCRLLLEQKKKTSITTFGKF